MVVAVVISSGVVNGVIVGLSGAIFVVAFDCEYCLSGKMGYLHLCKALFIYYPSLCSSCVLAQTVLDLCVRVLNTLYLADTL